MTEYAHEPGQLSSGSERVGQLGVVAGEEWEDGQVLVRLGRADADVEHVCPPCENVGGKVGEGCDSPRVGIAGGCDPRPMAASQANTGAP